MYHTQTNISYTSISHTNKSLKLFIGNIHAEVNSLLENLDEESFKELCATGHTDRHMCVPGPGRMDKASAHHSNTVILLDHFDDDSYLFDAVMRKMKSYNIRAQGDSVLRTVELLVWQMYDSWNLKGKNWALIIHIAKINKFVDT